eukprot:maker-scaffold_5-snap-gene-14.4-mRNA-1 protein AED:0.00 eAED:0.00 QI:101/1/1/1/1/1/2/264/116
MPTTASPEDKKKLDFLSTLNGPSLQQYQYARRSHFKRRKIKELVKDTTHIPISKFKKEKLDEFCVALGGVTKLYIAEIVETARKIQTPEDRARPLLPTDITAALEAMRQKKQRKIY